MMGASMYCPNCGMQSEGDGRFCASCGADLGEAAQVPEHDSQVTPDSSQTQPPQAAPQPTVPLPPQAYTPPSVPSQAATPTATAAAPPPVPSSGKGTMALLSVLVVLMLTGVLVGGYFGYKAISGSGDDSALSQGDDASQGTDSTSAIVDDTGDGADSSAQSGYATPEEAALSEYPADWVYDVLVNEGSYREYVVGPPSSEYTDVVVVEQQADGTWIVTDAFAFEIGDGDGQAASPEDESTFLVGDFLYAIKEDRADDAHSLTVEPFSNDPASAQFSNGDLSSFEILDATVRGDGYTVEVRSREVWAWGTEEWIYICVPTEAGYRISELLLP